jgi:hypothetical protein
MEVRGACMAEIREKAAGEEDEAGAEKRRGAKIALTACTSCGRGSNPAGVAKKSAEKPFTYECLAAPSAPPLDASVTH